MQISASGAMHVTHVSLLCKSLTLQEETQGKNFHQLEKMRNFWNNFHELAKIGNFAEIYFSELGF